MYKLTEEEALSYCSVYVDWRDVYRGPEANLLVQTSASKKLTIAQRMFGVTYTEGDVTAWLQKVLYSDRTLSLEAGTVVSSVGVELAKRRGVTDAATLKLVADYYRAAVKAKWEATRWPKQMDAEQWAVMGGAA